MGNLWLIYKLIQNVKKEKKKEEKSHCRQLRALAGSYQRNQHYTQTIQVDTQKMYEYVSTYRWQWYLSAV